MFGGQKPDFSFGQTTTVSNPAGGGSGGFAIGTGTTGATGGFSFGSQPSTTATTVAPAQRAGGGFSFGGPPNTTAGGTGAPAGSFGFGAPANASATIATTQPAAAPGGGFTIGGAAPSGSQAGGFSFGTTPTSAASQPASGAGGFILGAGRTTPASGVKPTATVGGFSFGGAGAKPASQTATAPGFSFGLSAGGTGTATTTTAPTGLQFGTQDMLPTPQSTAAMTAAAANMAAAAPGPMECPVCHDGFTLPKMLSCTHLVCHKCVVAWIEKGGNQAGCPLCRKPILPASHQGQDDIASLVDALPTDFATAAMVESEKRLSGSHVCSWCEDTDCTVFCLQCAIKLCSSCAKTHAKIPSSRDHVTEKLNSLSAEQLVTHHQVTCASHSGRQAELYCTNHEELVCMLCASSTHRKCFLSTGISELANEKREELKAAVKKLAGREKAVMKKISQLDIQVSDGQAKFKAMKDEVKATFDDLQMSVEAQRQKLNLEIQQREDAFLAERKSSKLDLEDLKSDLSAHRSTAQRLISSATDSSLLAMVGKLKSRLAALESQVLPDDPKTTTGSLTLNSDTVKKTKKAIAANGQDHDVPEKCLWCASSTSPQGRFSSFAKFAPPADSWECPLCIMRNTTKASKCRACATARRAQHSKASSTSPQGRDSLFAKFAPPADSWECPLCIMRNTPDASKCRACTTARPAQQSKASSTSPQGRFSLFAKFAPPADSWECPLCMVRNTPKASMCRACAVARPAQQSKGGWFPLEGPKYAAVIKVGDRVRRGRDWRYGSLVCY